MDLWVGLHKNLSGGQSLVGVLLLSSMVLDLTTVQCVLFVSTCFNYLMKVAAVE